MDSKHLEELTKTIAERNGTTPEAVRREMEAPRNSAWDTDDSSARCCFSERMRKLFRKNEKNVLRFCNKKAKEKRRLQRVKKPM